MCRTESYISSMMIRPEKEISIKTIDGMLRIHSKNEIIHSLFAAAFQKILMEMVKYPIADFKMDLDRIGVDRLSVTVYTGNEENRKEYGTILFNTFVATEGPMEGIEIVEMVRCEINTRARRATA